MGFLGSVSNQTFALGVGSLVSRRPASSRTRCGCRSLTLAPGMPAGREAGVDMVAGRPIVASLAALRSFCTERPTLLALAPLLLVSLCVALHLHGRRLSG